MPLYALVIVVMALAGCLEPSVPDTLDLVVTDKAALVAMPLSWEAAGGARADVVVELEEEHLVVRREAGEVLARLPAAHLQLERDDDDGCAAGDCGELVDEECVAACRCAVSPRPWPLRDSLLVDWGSEGRLLAREEGRVLPRKAARFCSTTRSLALAGRFR